MKRILLFGLTLFLAVNALSCGGFSNKATETLPISISQISVSQIDGYVYENSSGSTILDQSVIKSPDTAPGNILVGAVARISGTNLSAITDETGHFVITGAPPGEYDLTIEYMGAGEEDSYGAVVEDINVPDEGLYLGWVRCERTGKIAGRVTLEGMPPGNERVAVFIPGTLYFTLTDEDGNYEIERVPVGTYKVAAAKEGYCTQVVSGVVVINNTTTHNVDVDLTSCVCTGSMTGFAYLVGQTDDSGIAVNVLNTDFSSTTAIDGSWTIAGIPPGVYGVRFSKAEFNSVTIANVEITDSLDPTIVQKAYLFSSSLPDNDGDGIPDYVDLDDDNDGYTDTADDFPLDPTEWLDTDNDGIGNNSDVDDDNDVFTDVDEIAEGTNPLDAASHPITQCNDGIDNDGDGFIDWPNDPGCSSVADRSEHGTNDCDDGIDNNGDTVADWPDDPACVSITDTMETKAVGLSAGAKHSCALTDSGGVKCWGFNNRGQLGDSSYTNRSVPVDVVGLESGVLDVSTGNNYSCALTVAGGVKCWGGNDMYGNLGNGLSCGQVCPDQTSNFDCCPTPHDVTGLTSGVKQISSGLATCVVTDAGGVKCWGRNYWGCLGDGTTTDRSTPVDVVGLSSGVVAVKTAGDHSCAITETGGLKCWGWGTGSYIPVDVLGLESGVVQVTMGYDHTCVLMDTGGVKCWGQGRLGILGDGTTEARSIPGDVIGLTSHVVAIDSLYWTTCAITDTGGVKCWDKIGAAN